MKKSIYLKIPISIILLSFLSGCSTLKEIKKTAYYKTTDVQKMNLKGRVKSIEVKSFTAKRKPNYKYSKDEYKRKWITTFNRSGNKTKKVLYNA